MGTTVLILLACSLAACSLSLLDVMTFYHLSSLALMTQNRMLAGMIALVKNLGPRTPPRKRRRCDALHDELLMTGDGEVRSCDTPEKPETIYMYTDPFFWINRF